MTKKVKISFLILVWSIVAVQIYVNHQDKERQHKLEQESLAVTAFSVMDQQSDGNVITGQGYFGKMEISETIKKEMLENLAQKLGFFEKYSFRQNQSKDFDQTILTGKNEDVAIDLRIVSKGQQPNPKQYILVEIEAINDRADLYDCYEQIEQIFEEIGVQGQVHIEMQVQKNGKKWKAEKS